jgi:type I restriction enzyme S subunit
MNPQTLLEKFDVLVEPPGAVDKLRQLVLELALRGKLLPPVAKANSEPSGQTRTNGQIKTGIPDELFEIPPTWKWLALDEVARSCGQKRPDSRFTYIDVGSIDNSKGQIKGSLQVLDEASAPSRARKVTQVGAVLFGTVRPYLKNIAIIELEYSPAAVASTAFAVLYPEPFLDSKFLYYWLRSPSFEREVGRHSKGVAYPAISDGKFWKCPIPLPPAEEQKEIVAKLDELMGLCDRLEAQQDERQAKHAVLARASLVRFADSPTPANLNFLFHKSYTIDPAEIRKSLFTLALQGKLVMQDPSDEPAIVDLKDIACERAALIEARKLRPNNVSEISQTRSLQYEVPTSWRWFRLGDVAFFQEGPGIRNWQFRTHGTKLLNVQNIVDGRLVLENTSRYISEKEFEGTYRHFAVEAGDILFASSGASWGKTGWFEDPGYPVMLNTSMMRLKFYSKRCEDAFLLLFMRSDFFRVQMEVQLVGMQPNFGSTHLGRVYIPLPPLAEQRKIVAKVDQLMSVVDRLETQLFTANAAGASLMDAVVAELTAQN